MEVNESQVYEAVDTFLKKVTKIVFMHPLSEIPDWFPGEPGMDENYPEFVQNLLAIELLRNQPDKGRIKELRYKLRLAKESKVTYANRQKENKNWQKQITEMRERSDNAYEERTFQLHNRVDVKNQELLLPYDEAQVRTTNECIFLLFLDTQHTFTSYLLTTKASIRKKKQVISAVSKKIRQVKEKYKSYGSSILKLGSDNGFIKLPNKQIQPGTWALLQVCKRHLNSLECYLTTSEELINHTFDTLDKVSATEIERFIWVEQSNLLHSRTLNMLYEMLIRNGYISERTTMPNFCKAFQIAQSFERIQWLKDVHELHALIFSLNKRRCIYSLSNDIWQAAVTTFKDEDWLDFNYNSLRSSYVASSVSSMNSFLDKCEIKMRSA